MGLVLGFVFIVAFALAAIGSLRIHTLGTPMSLGIPKLGLISLAIATLVIAIYLWNLTRIGTFNSHGVYFEAHLYLIGSLVVGIILSFLKNKNLGLIATFIITTAITTFLIVNLWAFLGPSLTIFGLQHYV